MPRRDPDAESAERERKEAMATWREQAAAELEAMQTAFTALHDLDRDARRRALQWLGARLEKSPYFGEPPF